MTTNKASTIGSGSSNLARLRNLAKHHRSTKGNQIAELGPALIIILIVVLFPLINLIYLAAGYASAWYLNHLVVREIAMINPNNDDQVIDEENSITSNWANNGVAHFIGIYPDNYQTKVSHATPVYTPSKTNPELVRLTTTVTVRPLFYIPFFKDLPGVGKDMVFAISEERPQEDKGKD
jgi:hypothetical protein